MSGGGETDGVTETTQAVVVGVGGPRTFDLSVENGPDAGLSFRIDGSLPFRLLLGKSAACELRLSDPQVSRRHVSVELAEHRVVLDDLDSTNGTFVNGVRVRSAFLAGGETVRIGRTTLRVTATEERRGVPARDRFGRVLGGSDAMRRLYPLCERLAQTDVPVVIEGETGTGKEQLAEALHAHGPRAEHPYVVFDCTTVAPNLIESELFGHERGAFTGSSQSRAGVFEQADGGTLLIDEVGDLPLELQPKLLRAVERGEVVRVGGNKRIRVNVRIIAATRRDLDKEVQKGRFRDDLFHRIAVTRLELPPLRARRGDVRMLALHFAEQAGFSSQALPESVLAAWEDEPWSGNVRELRNAVTRLLALGDLAALVPTRPSRLPEPITATQGGWLDALLAEKLPWVEARRRMLEEFEQRYIERLLQEHDGNVTRAAETAGVGRRYLQRLKKRGESG